MDGLEVRDVSFQAAGRDILSDVSLGVAPGETVALLGPSGSGKTTLLRVIAGLDHASMGRVFFNGQDLSGLPAHLRGFGLMFQDHALFPHLNVEKNVAFGLRGAAGRSATVRVGELLDLVGLGGFEKRRIDKLSGGERQRVALARALAPSPKLLMLDEPLASLDRALRGRLVDELREILSRLDIPAIYVTHDQMEAFALADRVVILDQGRIARTGTPRELWRRPGTEFVARFLGMENIVDGERGADGLVRTAVGEFGPLPGKPGPVRILLREEGATLAEGPGPNVVASKVRAAAFRGAVTLLELARGGIELAFELPSSVEAPGAGAEVWVAVAEVAELEAEEGRETAVV